LCYRGLGNDVYYILEQDKSITPTTPVVANTLNANQPIVWPPDPDSLRYWVTQMHVDGFRFDLASILSRDEEGRPPANPPVLWDIESDPWLAGTKRIAEAWDAAGLYQVGSFIGDRCRSGTAGSATTLRRFLKGDNGSTSGVATRILGSPDFTVIRSASRTKHQFCDLPRRLYPQRSGLVQPQAQRGQRREQPRRLR